jgi:hypothetical protein
MSLKLTHERIQYQLAVAFIMCKNCLKFNYISFVAGLTLIGIIFFVTAARRKRNATITYKFGDF